jgi:ATP-dependent DNA ligase
MDRLRAAASKVSFSILATRRDVARSVDEIPQGREWQYEPKWDGFRCLLSRDGSRVELRSKSGEDLTRYFPELVDAALRLKASPFVLDGEIVVPHGRGFSFDDLLQRIHPAASRVQKLSRKTPALFIAFDLLKTARDSSFPNIRCASDVPHWKTSPRFSSNRTQVFGCRPPLQTTRLPRSGWRDPAADVTA